MSERKRIKVLGGIVAGFSGFWGVLKHIVDVATLPKNLQDMWISIVKAPDYIPWIIFAVCLASLIWAWWPMITQKIGLQTSGIYQPRSLAIEGEVSGSQRISLTSLRKPPNWVPLHTALRYLVYDTKWAAAQPKPNTEKDFNLLVGNEIMENLARGEVASRGKLGWDNPATMHRTTEPIPAQYWTNAFMQAHGEIVLADDNRCAVGRQGENCYIGVVVDQNDVKRIWPRRTTQLECTPIAQFCEALRHKIEIEKVNSEYA